MHFLVPTSVCFRFFEETLMIAERLIWLMTLLNAWGLVDDLVERLGLDHQGDKENRYWDRKMSEGTYSTYVLVCQTRW